MVCAYSSLTISSRSYDSQKMNGVITTYQALGYALETEQYAFTPFGDVSTFQVYAEAFICRDLYYLAFVLSKGANSANTVLFRSSGDAFWSRSGLHLEINIYMHVIVQ